MATATFCRPDRVFLLAALALLAGCSQITTRSDYVMTEIAPPPKRAETDRDKALWYVPNRLLDLVEIVRFGQGVGPGLGPDIRITRWGQLAAQVGLDAGIGWEGRLHEPFRYGWGATAAFGPWRASRGKGRVWKKSDLEISFEWHGLLHVSRIAIDLAEIGDFFVGFAGRDPLNDDY